MFDTAYSTLHDLDDVAPMLKQYGEVCVIWKRGYTASFKWFGHCANVMENIRERTRRVNEILNPNPAVKLGDKLWK